MIGAILRMPARILVGALVLIGSMAVPALAQDVAPTSPDGATPNASSSFAAAHSSSAAPTAPVTSNSPVKSEKVIRPLSVGDKVPDIEFENILNYSSSTAKISDFKGKLVIIDFWGKYCGSCIAALPKIDSLQNLYKDKIQVITVTQLDSKAELEKVFQRNKKTKDLKLPVVINENTLVKYFPHQLVSHVVWIGGDGVVKAITGSEYINNSNIQKALANSKVNWPIKQDVPGYDYKRPFAEFSQKEITEPSFMYSSSFTGHLDGVSPPNGRFVNEEKKTATISFYNHSIISLCKIALDYSSNSKPCVLYVNDTSRFRPASNEYLSEWEKRNTYCYSITLPIGMSENENTEIVKSDLLRWLSIIGVSVKKENDKYIITEKQRPE